MIFVNTWLSGDKSLGDLVYTISKRYKLTARGMVSMLKVSRTIADLEENKEIKERHIIEASAYRTGFNQSPGSYGSSP